MDGRPAVGAVYDVVRDELFSAAVRWPGRRGTARRSGSRRRPTLGHALVGTGFSYEPDRRRQQAEVLVAVLPQIRDIRRQGAAALDLCSVACGRLDAYYERGLAPWDLAAGGLIAREAGAVVTDLDGGPPIAGAVLAATPGVAAALLAVLQDAGAAGDALTPMPMAPIARSVDTRRAVTRSQPERHGTDDRAGSLHA